MWVIVAYCIVRVWVTVAYLTRRPVNLVEIFIAMLRQKDKFSCLMNNRNSSSDLWFLKMINLNKLHLTVEFFHVDELSLTENYFFFKFSVDPK